MSGPGVVGVKGALDQEHLGGAWPLAKHDRDGGLGVLVHNDGIGPVARETATNVFNIHDSELSGPRARPSPQRTGNSPLFGIHAYSG